MTPWGDKASKGNQALRQKGYNPETPPPQLRCCAQEKQNKTKLETGPILFLPHNYLLTTGLWDLPKVFISRLG